MAGSQNFAGRSAPIVLVPQRVLVRSHTAILGRTEAVSPLRIDRVRGGNSSDIIYQNIRGLSGTRKSADILSTWRSLEQKNLYVKRNSAK
jgi:hypothetical protein